MVLYVCLLAMSPNDDDDDDDWWCVVVVVGKAPICARVTRTLGNGFAGVFHVHPQDIQLPPKK